MDRRSLAAACLCWSLAAFPAAFCQEATVIRNNLDPEQENPLASVDAQNNRRAKVHRADDAALKKAIDSLSVSESIHGPEHPETAKCLHNLAWCYKSRGDFAAAERDYLRAMRIREKSLAAEDPATASTVYNLAALYRQQGKLAAAEPLYLRALKINEKSLGAEHPNTAKCLNGLANLYKNQGNFVAMEQSLLRALSIQERALSPGHPEIGRTLGDLAGCYKKQGKREQAVQMYQRALRTMELSSDRNDPAIANLLNNMAEVSPSPNAEQLLQRALQINETSLGRSFRDTCKSCDDLHPQRKLSAGGNPVRARFKNPRGNIRP